MPWVVKLDATRELTSITKLEINLPVLLGTLLPVGGGIPSGLFLFCMRHSIGHSNASG